MAKDIQHGLDDDTLKIGQEDEVPNEQSDVARFSARYFDNYDGAGRSYDDYMKLGVTDPMIFHQHISALGLHKPKSMLDLGAADGSALLYYKDRIPSVETVHGVEISP